MISEERKPVVRLFLRDKTSVVVYDIEQELNRLSGIKHLAKDVEAYLVELGWTKKDLFEPLNSPRYVID